MVTAIGNAPARASGASPQVGETTDKAVATAARGAMVLPRGRNDTDALRGYLDTVRSRWHFPDIGATCSPRCRATPLRSSVDTLPLLPRAPSVMTLR
jgi:hypothetical protein